MEPTAQAKPGYFVWQAPGKPIAVHLNLDVVDKMSAEVMRGFSSLPKRGAEVGGILVGSIEIVSHESAGPGQPEPEFAETAIVHVDSFEAVPCAYSRGPSYLFGPAELNAFANTLTQLESDPFSSSYPVGYFRSHTREGLDLAPEDLDLLSKYFVHPAHLALVIKPYATKAGTAGFFFREDGAFPAATPLEFLFRRREMTGEAAPPRRSMQDRQPRTRDIPDTALDVADPPVTSPDRPPAARSDTPRMDAAREAARLAEVAQPPSEVAPPPSYYTEQALIPSSSEISFPPLQIERPPRRWLWFPVCLAFLLLGLALGFQAAPTFWPALRGGDDVKNMALRLTVSRSGDNLNVRWNQDAPAVKAAQRGVLEIEDNGNIKPAELDAAHLHDGTVIYQSNSNEVKFRLVIYLSSRLTVVETVDWKQ